MVRPKLRKRPTTRTAAVSAAAGRKLRWQRRAEARPKEILDAALAEFAQKGFAAARMESIAKRAHVSKGTLYLYFDSKEAIFRALVQEVLGSELDRLAERVTAYSGPTAPLLSEMLRTIHRYLSESDRAVLPKIVIAEAGNFPDLAKAYRETVIDRGMGMLTALYAKAQAQGEFRKMPVEHAAHLTIAPVLLAVIWRTTFASLDPQPYDYDGLIEAHIATLTKGLAL
jgi:AcrR family transcriptional regulator